MQSSSTFSLNGRYGQISIERQEDGFPLIRAGAKADALFGLGFIHAVDRQMQMWMLKTVCMGRASEWLAAEPDLIALDRLLRWIDFYGDAGKEYERLGAKTKALLEAYCSGVNAGIRHAGTPFEMRLVRHPRPAWEPRDILALIKMIGFLGLTQTQGDSEKFIIHLLREGIPVDLLRELFPALKDKVTPDYLQTLRSLRSFEAPGGLSRLSSLFAVSASNNWVVGPSRTEAEQAIVCGDPHLSLSLPSVWYPVNMQFDDGYFIGATMAGAPLPVFGRTADLSWTVTYGTADTIDYSIEEIRQGRYRRGNRWLPLKPREDLLKPKGKEAQKLRFYETDAGLIEGEVVEDGHYLCYAWTGRKDVSAETVESFLKLYSVKDVKTAQKTFAAMPFAAFHWVCADREGNIGYQMSGVVPKRQRGVSGLLPFVMWNKKRPWTGMVAPEHMPQSYNPPEGYIVTANNDLGHLAKADVFTLPMPSYRADRITRALKQSKHWTVDEMKELQYDRLSLQAEKFMHILRPLLPDTRKGKLLAEWNLCYEADSIGATLFEAVYRELLFEVFGTVLGKKQMQAVIEQSSLFAMLHGFFDRVLLKRRSRWFGDREREEIMRIAIERALSMPEARYGQRHSFYIENLFFGGKLPRFLGFDAGPLPLPGSRATIPQAQVFRLMGRQASFAPSIRFITDMGTDEAFINNPGGPSDRRFSDLYTKGLDDWLTGRYYRYAAPGRQENG
ncbi:MAG: penicillin acylase family protein [Leptonema illini]|uniref:Penicillin acylase family protein n=1 Tax=Leptonema illini TaxID=183 RepID=A0A833H202_9LEPT|nr:MAG: penicillin acylase family protein [Leptonema illini]